MECSIIFHNYLKLNVNIKLSSWVKLPISALFLVIKQILSQILKQVDMILN